MKKLAWKAALGIVGTAALGATTACTVTTGTYIPDGSVSFGDDGADALATGSDAPATETGTQLDAGADSSSCPVSINTGSAACDQCTGASCCAEFVACDTADDAGVDDAGLSACEQLTTQVSECVIGRPDAGLDAGTFSSCYALWKDAYSVSAQQEAQALFSCLSAKCPQACR